MLTIRLQRTGSKNRASFRLVLAESYRAASKKAVEVLGHYNPRNKEFGIKNQERLQHWLSKHVALSPTAHNLLVEKKILTAKKVKAWKPKKSAEAGSSPAAQATTMSGKATAEVQSVQAATPPAPTESTAPVTPAAEEPKPQDEKAKP